MPKETRPARRKAPRMGETRQVRDKEASATNRATQVEMRETQTPEAERSKNVRQRRARMGAIRKDRQASITNKVIPAEIREIRMRGDGRLKIVRHPPVRMAAT